jgi:protein O-mannosyl-transferase
VLTACVIFIPLAAKTIIRNRDWKDYLTLYRHDMPYLKNSAKANAMYAGTLLEEVYTSIQASGDASMYKNDIDTVVRYFKRTLEVYPDYTKILNNLGSVYFTFYQDYDKAIPLFERAVRLNPDYYQAFFSLGNSWEIKGDYVKAEQYYRKSISIKPTYSLALSNLANLRNSLGDYKEASALNEQLMKADSSSDVPYLNMGNYSLLKKDTLEALAWWEKAVHKNPSNKNLITGLATYYRQHGNAQKADYYYNFPGK